ncbi:helix-turn-helix transcriptional regulator [Paenibacillus sp. GCM10027626]|uniref:helix-turn-helix transcriptional regulator n=1 Tax=Paenibacillus sp. GCM10027626 TaxID=3273411 RepID=UPI003644BC13
MRIRKYDYVTREAMAEEEGTGGIHPYHEMLYIASGEVMLKWMGTVYRAVGPALFLLTPNTPHQLIVTSPQSSYGFLELELDPADYFPSFEEIQIWNEMQGYEDWGTQAHGHIFSCVEQMWDMLRMPKYSRQLRIEVALLDSRKIFLFIHDFLENDTAEQDERKIASEEAVHFLMRFMETDYRENITLNTLTQYVHLNTSYLIRLFHRVTGMSPLGYLQELRMSAAKSFLSMTTMSVQEVAEAVGYQSIHYFSRLFKQKYGQSPTQWRNGERGKDRECKVT